MIRSAPWMRQPATRAEARRERAGRRTRAARTFACLYRGPMPLKAACETHA